MEDVSPPFPKVGQLLDHHGTRNSALLLIALDACPIYPPGPSEFEQRLRQLHEEHVDGEYDRLQTLVTWDVFNPIPLEEAQVVDFKLGQDVSRDELVGFQQIVQMAVDALDTNQRRIVEE